MSEERLQEIKDSISLQYKVQEANDLNNFNIFTDEEQELVDEIERLNNIIKRFEEDLREVYLTFGEFSEEYTENRIKELKGADKE